MSRLLCGLMVLLCTWLAACATPEPPLPIEQTGLVVASVTFERSIGVHAPVIVGADGKRVRFKGVGSPGWYPGLKQEDPDIGEKGGTLAVHLKPGPYTIVGWEIARSNTIYRSSRPTQIPFQVELGQAVYLGNLHFSDDWETVVLRDRAERDLALLHQRTPALKDFPVTAAIARDASVPVGAGYTSRTELPFLFLPAPR